METVPIRSEWVYKQVSTLSIRITAYLPRNAVNVPVLVWFHGGGLLQGHRDNIPPHLLRSVDEHRHALVSADYRLAPQANISRIFDDVRDCVRFVGDSSGLEACLGRGKINTNKVAVAGSSAGGYLALLAGLYCQPKPSVILSIYPITDPLGIFFTTPQPRPAFIPPGTVTNTAPPSYESMVAFTDRAAVPVANCAHTSARSQFYYFMLAHANLADLLGMDVVHDSQHNQTNDQWRIAKVLTGSSSTSPTKLPPTYIVHGDMDRAVGVEQSDEVVGAMIGLGYEVQYERLQGKDHLFDKASDVSMSSMYRFMHSHLHDSKL